MILQFVLMFSTFCLTLLSILLPLKLIPRNSNVEQSPLSQRIIRLCNSTSGGVFLASCFVQLVPYVQAKFQHILDKKFKQHEIMVISQCSVMMGFFMILVVEHIIHTCKSNHKYNHPDNVTHHRNNEVIVTKSFESSVYEDSDEEHSEDNILLLKRSRNVGETSLRNSVSRNSSEKNQANNAVEEDGYVSLSTLSVSGGHDSHGHSHDNGGHGHSHLPELSSDGTLGLRSLLLLAALSLHSLFEGLAVGLQTEMLKLVGFYTAVILHEILVSFALGMTLAKQDMSISTIVKLSVAYSIMIPVGMALGLAIGEIKSTAGELTSAVIQGLTAGTFIYVVFLEIIPPEIKDKKDWLLKLFFLLFGFIIITALSLALPSHEH